MQRSESNNDTDILLLAIVGASLLIGIIVWKFSETLGLDFGSGSVLLCGLIFMIIGNILSIVYGVTIFIPAIMAVFMLSLFPALDYWSLQNPTYALYAFTPDNDEVRWWAQWYTKCGLFFACLLPYLRMYIRNRY